MRYTETVVEKPSSALSIQLQSVSVDYSLTGISLWVPPAMLRDTATIPSLGRMIPETVNI